MQGKTHIVFGATLGFAAGYLTPGDHQMLVMAVAGAAGSLLPDIDHPKSTFGKKVFPLSYLISKIFGHRGITHSLLAVVGLSYLLIHYAHSVPDWAIGIVIGYFSHLLGDFLTPAGVPFFWPNKTKFSSPIGFRTGGWGESFFFFLMIVADGALLWNHH